MDGIIPDDVPVAEQDGFLRGWEAACAPFRLEGCLWTLRDLEALCVAGAFRSLSEVAAYCAEQAALIEGGMAGALSLATIDPGTATRQ